MKIYKIISDPRNPKLLYPFDTINNALARFTVNYAIKSIHNNTTLHKWKLLFL